MSDLNVTSDTNTQSTASPSSINPIIIEEPSDQLPLLKKRKKNFRCLESFYYG